MSLVTRDAGRSSGNLSSLPGMGLWARVATAVWRRGNSQVNRPLGNTPPKTRTPHEQIRPFPSLFPYDIVEMIIAHFAHDRDTLKACSVVCRSWYTAAVPHLYHTFTLTGSNPKVSRGWMEPLSKLYELGLIHFVRELRVRQTDQSRWFVPGALGDHFSALTNVHTLKVGGMQVYRFIPHLERYFKHFSPSVRSIALYDPRCTPRQLSLFLSLFPNLDDIEIREAFEPPLDKPVANTELVPFSAPKLRGKLVLHGFRWVDTWRHMIDSCGGLRFRHMDLRGSASCAPLLLEACAETLVALRFDARDGSFKDLDLSQLKVLRSLQVEGWVTDTSLRDHHLAVLMRVFCTIKSPAFSELVLIHSGYGTYFIPQEVALFETLREMNKIKPFKLVFLLGVSDILDPRGELTEALDLVAAKGRLDFLDSQPTIRTPRARHDGWDYLDFD